MTYPEPFRYDTVDVRYVEDGQVHQTVINPWNPQLHSSEVLLWNNTFKLGRSIAQIVPFYRHIRKKQQEFITNKVLIIMAGAAIAKIAVLVLWPI